jgi:enoyl-CoA hydratase/carnithine racemase
MTELVIVKIDNGVGELILNRPERRNSLIGPLVWELQSGLESLEEDDNCKAIMISGAKGYFCAGLDLKAFASEPAPEWKGQFQKDWATFHRTIYHTNKPIIGALEGFAIAGGSALALACDYLVVGNKAFLHVSEVERNMMAPINIAWLTIRHSYHVGLKMALLGERHYGEALVRLGIADRSVQDEEVISVAREIATRFAEFESTNVQRLKGTLRRCSQRQDFDVLLETIKGS